MPPRKDLEPPLHVFQDLDQQTDSPKKDSDVNGRILEKLKFTRSNKQPELPPLPDLSTGFHEDYKDLQNRYDAATSDKDFPSADVFDV